MNLLHAIRDYVKIIPQIQKLNESNNYPSCVGIKLHCKQVKHIHSTLHIFEVMSPSLQQSWDATESRRSRSSKAITISRQR